ncbi:MAG TPA: Uma2 family endonuclease [Lacipirellulaceae bacterium]|nr:Uma2 family endonuclease [Lacipirellulaceae bacterium]
MSASPQRALSPEEYLELERSLPTKHAYFRGEMFAMGGASREHNLISGNIAAAIHSQLVARPCEFYQHDMRVKVSASGLYTYPDVVITCDRPRFEDKELDTLLNPQVIIEVLSDSTEKYDRGKKFEQYQQIDSLREYLLVAHGYPSVDQHLRGDDGAWTLRQVRGLDGTVRLPSVECELRLADVYAKVAFPGDDEQNRAAGLLSDDESRKARPGH